MNIMVFSPGDKLPDLPDNLTEFSVPGLRARFGFKIETDGMEHYWVPASETDFRNSEAERLGIKPEDVNTATFYCNQTGPTDCSGFCHPGSGDCKLLYNSREKYYYCACA